jgi:putative intracellular protease/amidase
VHHRKPDYGEQDGPNRGHRPLRIAGKLTVLDAGPPRKCSPEILRLADIVSPNETELECLSGEPVSGHVSAREAAEKLLELGVQTVEIRLAEDLSGCDGLVLPGGETTTQRKLARGYGLWNALAGLARQGIPILATCAGLILLARRIDGQTGSSLAILDIDVRRPAHDSPMKSGRGHTENRQRLIVDQNLLADDIAFTLKVPMPEFVTEDRNRMRRSVRLPVRIQRRKPYGTFLNSSNVPANPNL